jgi:hypothetical protein
MKRIGADTMFRAIDPHARNNEIHPLRERLGA